MRVPPLSSIGVWRLPWMPDGTPCEVSMGATGFTIVGAPPYDQPVRVEKAIVSSVEVARVDEVVGERPTASLGQASLFGILGGPLAFAGWVVGTSRMEPVRKGTWWLIIGFADGSSAAFELVSGLRFWGAPRRVADQFAKDFRRHRERYARR